MSDITRVIYPLITALLVAVLVGSPAAAQSELEPPEEPVSVEDILYARPFALEQGYASAWQKERPVVTSGFIVVLRVDPALVMPRAARQPVLYAGRHTVEPITSGYPSGILAAIVPGPVDLRNAGIWFGEPGLPEAVDAAAIRANVARAEETGIRPLPSDRVEHALSLGGETLSVPDRAALLRQARALVRPYLP
jgi:hypothetical protein